MEINIYDNGIDCEMSTPVFPPDPKEGDRYSSGKFLYVYEGGKWISIGGLTGGAVIGPPGPPGPSGDLRGQLIENAIIGSGVPSTIDVGNGMVHYYSTSGSSGITINIRKSASETLDSSLVVGETVAITLLASTNSTSYFVNTVQVDGSTQTVRWNGAEAPSESEGSGVDAYSFQVIKTGSNTFLVFGSVNNFG